jgi:hypothetical protein
VRRAVAARGEPRGQAGGERLRAAVYRDVAAEQAPSFGGQAAIHGGAQRADAGDGRDAEGEAGENDPHAGEAAAQVPQGKPEGK